PDGPARAGRFDLLLLTLPHGPEPLPMLRAAFGCYPPTPIARAGPGPSNYGRSCNPDAARWLDLAAGAPAAAARGDAERGPPGSCRWSRRQARWVGRPVDRRPRAGGAPVTAYLR